MGSRPPLNDSRRRPASELWDLSPSNVAEIVVRQLVRQDAGEADIIRAQRPPASILLSV